jgi:hypothetical protein
MSASLLQNVGETDGLACHRQSHTYTLAFIMKVMLILDIHTGEKRRKGKQKSATGCALLLSSSID